MYVCRFVVKSLAWHLNLFRWKDQNEDAIDLLSEPVKKCWSVVYRTCCLGFKRPVWHTLAIQKPEWNTVGVCQAVSSGTECHADTSCPQIWPFQLPASRTVHEPWRPSACFSLRCFFPSIMLKFSRESQCRLACLHPPLQIQKADVHPQSLSIISLWGNFCIKFDDFFSEQYIVHLVCLAILNRSFISLCLSALFFFCAVCHFSCLDTVILQFLKDTFPMLLVPLATLMWEASDFFFFF